MDVRGSNVQIGRNKKKVGVRISLYLSFNIKRNKAITKVRLEESVVMI